MSHLAPTACYVCGSDGPHPRGSHTYWPNADAEREFAAEARRRREARYSDGTTHPEAHYVATHRPA
jgi:hypothetical protein